MKKIITSILAVAIFCGLFARIDPADANSTAEKALDYTGITVLVTAAVCAFFTHGSFCGLNKPIVSGPSAEPLNFWKEAFQQCALGFPANIEAALTYGGASNDWETGDLRSPPQFTLVDSFTPTLSSVLDDSTLVRHNSAQDSGPCSASVNVTVGQNATFPISLTGAPVAGIDLSNATSGAEHISITIGSLQEYELNPNSFRAKVATLDAATAAQYYSPQFALATQAYKATDIVVKVEYSSQVASNIAVQLASVGGKLQIPANGSDAAPAATTTGVDCTSGGLPGASVTATPSPVPLPGAATPTPPSTAAPGGAVGNGSDITISLCNTSNTTVQITTKGPLPVAMLFQPSKYFLDPSSIPMPVGGMMAIRAESVSLPHDALSRSHNSHLVTIQGKVYVVPANQLRPSPSPAPQ